MGLILFPFKLTFALAGLPLRTSRFTLRLFGVRGTFALALGVGIGVLLAPRTGAETRRLLRKRYEEWQGERRAGGPAGASLPPWADRAEENDEAAGT